MFICHNVFFGTKRCALVTIIRSIHKTHYEVLNVDRNCSSKDIRAAFLSLSKKYHPDKNSDKDTHAKYVRIMEAYNILSKPAARVEYDLGLRAENQHYKPNYNYPNPMSRSWQNSYGARERMYYQDYARYKRSDGGVEGGSVNSKKLIVFLLVLIMSTGSYIQYLGIMGSYDRFDKVRQQKTKENMDSLKDMTEENAGLSTKQRLQKMVDKYNARHSPKQETDYLKDIDISDKSSYKNLLRQNNRVEYNSAASRKIREAEQEEKYKEI